MPPSCGKRKIVHTTEKRVDMSDIKSATGVTETFSQKECNNLIRDGWSLLDTAPGKDEQGYPIVKYVLANIPKADEKK